MIVIEPIGLVIFIGIVAIIIYMLNSEEWKEKLEEKGAFVMSYKDLNPGEEYYYREIPCNGDLYYINKLAKNYCREDEDKESMKDSIKILIESILMDWYYKEIITLDETIQIINEEKIDNEFDKELMQVIKEIIKDKSIRDNKKIGQYFGKWFIHSGDYVEKNFGTKLQMKRGRK